MSPEKLTGPKKSKVAIEAFQDWLIEKCRSGKQEKDKLLAEYQFISGHSLRKLNEWLDAILSNGKIRLVRNNGEDYLALASNTEEKEKREPQLKLSKKARDFFAKCSLREEMKSGPCKDAECPPFSEDGCQYCSAYREYARKSKQPEEDFEE